MGWIADRIVNVDALATTISEQVSVEMLEARRAERNYLLLRDPAYYVEANRASIAKARETLIEIQNLAPSEQQDAQKALDELHLYQQCFEAAVSILGAPGQAPTDRIQAAVRAYEKDLNGLLTRARLRKRAQLVDELRSRVDSFDIQMCKSRTPNCDRQRRILRTRAKRPFSRKSDGFASVAATKRTGIAKLCTPSVDGKIESLGSR